MPDLNREVAGLRCRDVLALLPDYVDGELSPDDVDRVSAHLRACDRCEKFGGEYGTLVATLRTALRPRRIETAVRSRLAHRLGEVWEDEGR